MENTIERKIAMFEDLTFDEAKEVILELSKELTQSDKDVFYHISITLPELAEDMLEKGVLTNIYREIAIANEAFTEQEKRNAIMNLVSHEEKLKDMLEQEKRERAMELVELDKTLSTL